MTNFAKQKRCFNVFTKTTPVLLLLKLLEADSVGHRNSNCRHTPAAALTTVAGKAAATNFVHLQQSTYLKSLLSLLVPCGRAAVTTDTNTEVAAAAAAVSETVAVRSPSFRCLSLDCETSRPRCSVSVNLNSNRQLTLGQILSIQNLLQFSAE